MQRNKANVYKLKGDSHYKQGLYQMAIAYYTQAIRLDPSDAEAYYSNRGTAYCKQGKYQKAMADYTEAIRLDPSNPIVYYNRGNAYSLQGKHQKAIAEYTHAISIKLPHNALAYCNRGTAYFRTGSPAEAISDINKAIKLKPNDVMIYNWLKHILLNIKPSDDLSQITKSDLLSAIKNLNNEDQIPLLKECLKKGTGLGVRFWKQEGFFPCSLKTKDSALYEIYGYLKQLEPSFVIQDSPITTVRLFTGNRMVSTKRDELDEPEYAIRMHNVL